MVCALFCLWSFLLLMSFCTYACFCSFIRFCKYVVYKYSRTILWERSCFQPESVLSQIRSSFEVVRTGFYSVCCLLSSFLNFITGIRNRLSDVARRPFSHYETVFSALWESLFCGKEWAFLYYIYGSYVLCSAFFLLSIVFFIASWHVLVVSVKYLL